MSKAKKVYISVDIEGMEGVVSKRQIMRNEPDFQFARKRLAKDVNAAVEAALEYGAEEVVVADGHADMENIILEDLHPEAKLISGAMRQSLQMPLIEMDFDAVVIFGHAGAGQTVGGVLSHMYNAGKIYNIRINGKTVNTETVMNAIVAGYYDTPLVTVIGDKALSEEVKSFIPNVETVVVKEGLSRFSAISIHPEKARELIKKGVKNGLERANEIKPLKVDDPITMEIDFKDANMADTAELMPGVERISPRTVKVTADGETIFKLQELLVFRLIDMI